MTSILNVLLEVTIYSAILYAVILLFKKVFHKHISAALNYAVWALLIIRLLVPVTIDSGFSLFVIKEPQTLLVQSGYTSDENPGLQANNNTTAIHESSLQDISSEEQIDNSSSLIKEDSKTPSPDWTIDWQTGLVLLWAAGIVGSVSYIIVFWKRLNQRIKRKRIDVPLHVINIVEECKKDLDIEKKIKVSMHDWLNSPSLSTTLRPRLLLPAGVAEMDHQQIEFAVRHELTHFKRKDHLVNLFLILLRCIYWFNPIVWLAFPKIQEDMETVCDASITSHLKKKERTCYINTMIELSCRDLRCVLGMGIRKGRKTLEKRVRGIFMKKQTKPSVRIVAILLVCVMLVTCFTTACQPTPETPAVIGKNEETAQNAVPYNEIDFPDTYRDSYSKNGAEIIFEATVDVPDSETLPAYEVSPAMFSQDQVDTVIKGLFGEQQMYEPAQVTKTDLEPAYVQALADLKNKQEHPDQYENTVEYYQERADELKEQIENAPDTDTLKPVDRKLKKGSGSQVSEYYSGRGDLGKDEMATLSIMNDRDGQMGDISFLWLTNGNRYADMSSHYPDVQDNGPLNLKISKDTAVQKANDAVSRLGAGHMEYAGYATGILKSGNGQYPAEFDPQRPQAYLIYYTRTIDGVPVTYDERSSSNNFADNSYAPPDLYERITVSVDDSGVTYIRWQGQIGIDRTLAESNRIISFEDVMTLAKEQLSFAYTVYDAGQQQSANAVAQAQPSSPIDKGEAVSNEVHIQRITLGLMQLPVKDEDRRVLAPVWDFFGYYQTKYQSGAKEMHYMNNKSILTINAINGNVIDRTQGY